MLFWVYYLYSVAIGYKVKQQCVLLSMIIEDNDLENTKSEYQRKIICNTGHLIWGFSVEIDPKYTEGAFYRCESSGSQKACKKNRQGTGSI